jgi:tetratricopeptide (TPR) repeat protein
MSRFFLAAMVLLFLLTACNNDTDDRASLSRPPYDKLTDSIDRTPQNAELYYRRGSLLYSNNQQEFAEKDIRRAWQLEPKEEYALSLTTVLKQKNADSAIAFLQEALKKLPNNIALQIGLARGYQQKNQLEKSQAILDRIIAQYPGQLDALVLKSELLKQENKSAESLAILEKAYALAPEDVDLVHTLAFDYAEAKNPKVLSLADSLIGADSRNRHAEPYYFKGLYFENTGNSKEAIRYFDEAIRHDYYFLDAYMDKGQTLYGEKKYGPALNTFQLAATITPTYAEAYYWMGKTQEAMGNKADARLNYQRAYGLDKTLSEAKEAADRL